MLLLCRMGEQDNAIVPEEETFPSSTREILRNAAERGIRYRETVGQRGVAPTPEAVTNLARFRTRLSDHGTDPASILALLDELGSPATVTMAGGRYFGFVNGGSLPVTVATNWLATAWDQNCALYTMSPAASVLEEVALEWVLEALRLPETSAGAFVVGATMANFTALAAARHAVLARSGWDVDNEGLFGAPPITVVEAACPTAVRPSIGTVFATT